MPAPAFLDMKMALPAETRTHSAAAYFTFMAHDTSPLSYGSFPRNVGVLATYERDAPATQWRSLLAMITDFHHGV